MAESPRRFPTPWRADGGYVVRDANEQALAYVYSRVKRLHAADAERWLRLARMKPRAQVQPSEQIAAE